MRSEKAALLAANQCSPMNAVTLEGFLGALLDEDLETLAELPGTPAQVLCSQFLHYAKTHTALRECLARETELFDRLADAARRLPAHKARKAHPKGDA